MTVFAFNKLLCSALIVQLPLLVSQQFTLVSAFQTPSPQITPLRVHHYVNSNNNVKNLRYHSSQLLTEINRKDRTNIPFSSSTTTSTTRRSTQLHMYNLPPGGPNKNDNPLSQLVSGALVVGGIILFFASPLGSFFFAITNSLFLLALITPVVLTIAFQVWQSLNTISGTCPNCGAPARIIKDPDQAGICFNCGTILQASSDGKNIEFAATNKGSGRGNDYIDMNNPSSGSSIFDSFFGGTESTSTGQQSSSSSSDAKSKASKFKREQTIIDVEVEKNKDDDAWQ